MSAYRDHWTRPQPVRLVLGGKIVKYISNDGRTFDTADECRAWDAGAEERAATKEAARLAGRMTYFDSCVHDLVGELLYYDRKEDGDLTSEDIEEMIASGEINLDVTVAIFRAALEEAGVKPVEAKP